jgi:hypothetical protein
MDADRQAERRRLIRKHHPDHGGDSEMCIAELRRFADQTRRAVPTALSSPGRVTLVSEQQWPVSLITPLPRRLAKRTRRAH